MAQVRCEDGRVLSVVPRPVLGRDGVPYEVVLTLLLDGTEWGVVGERCAYRLARAAERVSAGALGSAEAGVRAWARQAGADGEATWRALARHLPRDRELFALRSRDPDDLSGRGALRAVLDERRTFTGARWQDETCVVLEAWGEDGTGVRASLPVAAAVRLLDAVVAEAGLVLQEGDSARGVDHG